MFHNLNSACVIFGHASPPVWWRRRRLKLRNRGVPLASKRDAKRAPESPTGECECLIVGSEVQARGLPYPIPCGFLGAEVPIAWALQKNFSSSLKVLSYPVDK